MTPSFSIIIPFHNNTDTITTTVASVLWQHNASYEVIIVDDRSSAHARNHIENLARRHDCVRIVDAAGEGPSAARNTGASVARGAYNWFLDSDDCLAPGALEKVATAFAANDALGVTFGRVRITDTPERETGGVLTEPVKKPTLPKILGENCVSTASNIAVRQQAFSDIRAFDETLSHAEDQEWALRALLHPFWQIEGQPFVTVHYRTTIGGLSTDLKKMEAGWQRIFDLHSDKIAMMPANDRRKARALFYRYLARRSLRLGQKRVQALRFFIYALVAFPSLIIDDFRRTVSTGLGALAVACFGTRPFRKLMA